MDESGKEHIFNRFAYDRKRPSVDNSDKPAAKAKVKKGTVQEMREHKLSLDLQKCAKIVEELEGLPYSEDLVAQLKAKSAALIVQSTEMHQAKVLGENEKEETIWWETVASIRSLMDDLTIADSRVCASKGMASKPYSTAYDVCLDKPQVDSPTNEGATATV